MFRSTAIFFGALLAAALTLSQPGFAACNCDPDLTFTNNPEWAGPYAQTASVDVDAGNSLTSFVTAAYWQIAGRAPSAAELNAQLANLAQNTGGNDWWRRIDTVNDIMNKVGRQIPRYYSNPWQNNSDTLFNTAPCHNVARDIGAVLMFFFSCPQGVNCGLDWANNHVTGMQTGYPDTNLWAPTGYYTPSSNDGFFYRELMDARYAGLQFFLPNVYGPDLSDGSMTHLANALGQVATATAGDRDVKIGLFDDTWGWGNYPYAPWNSAIPDLNNPANAAAAAASICNNKWFPFFDAIPAADRYTVNVGGQARPIIYFYNAGTLGAGGNASDVLNRCRALFLARYGVYPFLVVDQYYWSADPRMVNVADSRFTWKTVDVGLTNNLSTYYNSAEGITLDHATVRWDPVARDHGVAAINSGDQYSLHKGPELLQAALANSVSGVNILTLGTWNDLGEGTGINRAYDYYYNGAWLAPNTFMDLIRASQSQQSCPPVGTTATSTPTLTPTPTHGPLVADLENHATDNLTYWNGGGVYQYVSDCSSTKLGWPAGSGTAPGAYGTSAYAGCWAGVMQAASYTPKTGNPVVAPYSFLAFELVPGGSLQYGQPGSAVTSVLPYSINHGIQFDYEAGNTYTAYQIQVTTKQVLDYNYFQYTFTAPNTGWNTQVVYFPGDGSPALSLPPWAANPGLAFDPSSCGAVIFQVVPQLYPQSYSLCVDNITFAVPLPPTATPSRTVSPSATATPSGTASPTPSPMASPTTTSTATSTATPSPSPTLTVLVGSATSTPSPSPSPSVSPLSTTTGTPTRTALVTATPSPTLDLATPTQWISGTASPSLSGTPSPGWTPTASPTATALVTASPSPKPTGSSTGTVGVTPPSTATATRTVSPMDTVTASTTATPTSNPSSTDTPTATPIATPTATPTASPGPSGTPRPVASATPTQVASVTSSATPSPEPSLPPSVTVTVTPSMGAAPGGPSGSPQPIRVVAVPNPQHGLRLVFDIQIAGTATFMEFRIYTPAMVLASSSVVRGMFQPGWNTVPVPLAQALAPGLYYAEVRGGRGAGTFKGAEIGRFVYWP